MWSLYFFKLFSSENYSDDFEDEEDIDAPLPTKDGETNCKENPISEKTKAPKQVYISYIFDSLETYFITLADSIWKAWNMRSPS